MILPKLIISVQTIEGIIRQTMSNNHIQLNGNVYDARTGKMIQKKPRPVAPHQPIDGVAQPKLTNHTSTQMTMSKGREVTSQKSRTLMRNAVKKPDRLLPNADEIVRNAHQPIFKKQPRISDTSRLERARQINKSERIDRFSPKRARQPSAAKDRSLQTSSRPNNLQELDKPEPTSQQDQHRTMLSRAIDSARGHEQSPLPRQGITERIAHRLGIRLQTAKLIISGLMAVVILGSAIYFTLPHAALMIANQRAGIAANLPQYKPNGFALSSTVEYRPGLIAVEYNSRTDDRAYRVTQTKTDWNSTTLRTNFVEQQGLYQTVPHRGKTIFIYNGSNATWIDGGVWYTIEGSADLSSDQLLKIANSL
jgi:hypothetical protein